MKNYVCLGLNWKEVIQCGLELIFCCGWLLCLYLEQGGRAQLEDWNTFWLFWTTAANC